MFGGVWRRRRRLAAAVVWRQVPFGGDQFNLEHPAESAQKDSYFIYFYWVINIGALFSYFVMAQVPPPPLASASLMPSYTNTPYPLLLYPPCSPPVCPPALQL